MVEKETIYVVKADGTREPFDVAKLEHSLKRAGAAGKAAGEIIDTVRASISDGVTTREIYQKAFELLHKKEYPVALRYSIKRAVMELGPSGFPFEEFIAEILRHKGFMAETGQVVKGFCVEHEMDIVAWNKEKLVMVEAKFHNTLGTKSDLKVALYIKARFEDLHKMTFRYGGGGERHLDEGWLVTNTKFTSSAIEYGSCQGGLRMIGWNYPPVGNLHDMIIESKLHPLTCLVTLSSKEKKNLLDRGVVLCDSLKENPDLLFAIGLSDVKSKKVLSEIEAL